MTRSKLQREIRREQKIRLEILQKQNSNKINEKI